MRFHSIGIITEMDAFVLEATQAPSARLTILAGMIRVPKRPTVLSYRTRMNTCASVQLVTEVRSIYFDGFGNGISSDDFLNSCLPEGRDCDEAIDYCVLDPCQNDGQCTSKDGSYHCQCTIGYTGNKK